LLTSKKIVYDNSLTTEKFNLMMYISIIVIILFSAIRYDVGWDYMAYYETIELNRITNILLNHEYITIFLINIARKVGFPQLYFIINSVITISFITITIKRYSKDYWVSIFFFVTFPLFYLNSLSVIRNFTAIAIIFYGIKYIENKKIFKYLLLVIVASFIHKSAIIAIAFYLVRNFKFKRDVYMALILITPLISNLLSFIIITFLPAYSVYTNVVTTQQGTKAILIIVFVAFATIILKDRLSQQTENFNIYFNIYFIGVCIYLSFYRQGTLGHRLSLYGTIFSLIIIPEILKLFKKKWDRIIIKALFYLLCIAMFFYTIYVGSDTYIPYKTFFSY
jgi:hypothetical protein